jgi:hypothetical protein
MSLAEKTKDITEAVTQWSKLADEVFNLLQTPVGWILITMFIFWLLITKDFSHLFYILERKDKKLLDRLDLYISKPEWADKETFKALADIRDTHYFKMATGIYASKNIRNALIELNNYQLENISWHKICQANKYIKINKKNQIFIRSLTRGEKIEYVFHIFLGAAILALALLVCILAVFKGNTLGLKAFVSIYVVALVFGAAGVLKQNWSANAAKQIRKELAKNTSDSS